MNESNFLHVEGWMYSIPRQTATELWVYATIYGYCKNGGVCYASLETLAEYADCEKRTAQNAIKALERNNLIEVVRRNGSTSYYKVYPRKICMGDDDNPRNICMGSDDNPRKICTGSDDNPRKICMGGVQNLHGGGEKFATDNIYTNISYNKTDKDIARARHETPYQSPFSDTDRQKSVAEAMRGWENGY